eukprot:TRINITY_DN23956_c0_g1_i2.p1 TRINITY_DN23956_c0_g1~~TRINITY_DN23956_c0_g1_i2.p1  ORF type:complete len:559 (+),score=113.85 TRINITY_DN23956_c0_g1_i2:176-1678(+)
MAQLILKQYIPIRQKCLPVVNSQTKKHMETLSMRKAKKSLTFGSKSFLLGQNKNNKLEQPTKDTSQDLEKPPGIRLVDISLLKDPKSSCDNSLDNVHEPERTENENLSISPKCNPVESVDIHNYAWTSSPVFINHNDEAPLDLSKKKQPPEPPPTEEIFPLDLSKNNKNNESHHFASAEEPPPLMPIRNKFIPTSPPMMGKETDLPVVNKSNEQSALTGSQKQIITLDCSQQMTIPNQQAIGIPQILQLQPIQVVFTTNPVLHVDQTPTVSPAQLFPNQSLSPMSPNAYKSNTREKIKTKLNERSQNKQTTEVHVTDLGTSVASLVQPIQMVFTDGKFVQVLPSQSIQKDICEPKNFKEKKSSVLSKPNPIRIVKKSRKRNNPGVGSQASLTTLLEPLSIQTAQNSEGLVMINTYDPSHEYQNRSNNNVTVQNLNQNLMAQNLEKNGTYTKTCSTSPDSMVKTNEMVTSNGGVFCTFRNINRMKTIKSKNKARRKRAKPD